MSKFYWLSIGVMGVWRITHLLNAEDGPGRLLAKFRRLAGPGFFGEVLDCFYCLSMWVSAPFALFLGDGWAEKALLWPALSGAAILLERLAAPAIAYSEDREPEGKEKEGDQR